MNDTNKRILVAVSSFILGLGSGGAIAYFVTKEFYKKKCEEDIQNQTEYYMRKYEDILDKEGYSNDSSLEEKGNDEKPASVQETKEGISDIYRSHTPDEFDKTSYGSYFRGGNSDRSNDIADTKPVKKKVTRKSGPKMVDEAIWDANPDNYEKRFFIYYDVDSVMVDDETEQIVEDGETLIGVANLNDADQFNNVIYVSNSKTKTIYQVTVEQTAFLEVGND